MDEFQCKCGVYRVPEPFEENCNLSKSGAYELWLGMQ